LKISGFLLEASIYVHADFQRSVTFRSKLTAKLRKDPLKFLMSVVYAYRKTAKNARQQYGEAAGTKKRITFLKITGTSNILKYSGRVS